MRYPNHSTSTTHGSAPLSLQACQGRGWLLLPKPRGFGRRSRPLTALKALTTSGSRGGRGALPVRPATRSTRRARTHKGRGRGRPRPTPAQRTRDRKVRRDLRGTLCSRNDFRKKVFVKETRRRSWRHCEGAPLSLQHRKSGMGQQALTTLRPNEARTSRSCASLSRKRSRHRGQGRVEKSWVGGLKIISFQHGENSRHQPEGQ